MGDNTHLGVTKASVTELNMDAVEFSSTGIYKAIRDGAPGSVLQAIYGGEDITLKDREFQSTYLHLLVSLANPINEGKLVPIVYQLSNAGIDVHARDYKGRTALELAIGRELQDIMVALIRVGIDPKEKDYEVIIQNLGSPFQLELLDTLAKYAPGMWSAVSDDNTAMIHILVNSWCRININRDGLSLISFAKSTSKSPELISVLEDFMVTIEFVHATMAGDEARMLEFLMDSQPCYQSIMDISYQERWSAPIRPRSLRDTAKDMGHMHLLHLLPENEDFDGRQHATEAETNMSHQDIDGASNVNSSEGDHDDCSNDNGETVVADSDDDEDDVVLPEDVVFRKTFTFKETSESDIQLNLSVLDRHVGTRGSSHTADSEAGAEFQEQWYNFNEGRGSRHTGSQYMTPRLAEDYSKNWWKEKEKKRTQNKTKHKGTLGKKTKESIRANKESKMCIIS